MCKVSWLGVWICTVPPDILDYPTSSDQVDREGANVTLRCAAHGVPTPTVVWRKEAGDLLPTTNFSDTHSKKHDLYLTLINLEKNERYLIVMSVTTLWRSTIGHLVNPFMMKPWVLDMCVILSKIQSIVSII